jgi:hypothetical protein
MAGSATRSERRAAGYCEGSDANPRYRADRGRPHAGFGAPTTRHPPFRLLGRDDQTEEEPDQHAEAEPERQDRSAEPGPESDD